MAHQPLNAEQFATTDAPQILRRRRPRIALALAIVTVLSAGVSLAPSALADSLAGLRDALAQARAGSCGALRSDPIAEQAANKINQMTDEWLNHTGTQVPPEDPLPGLKILGYGGNKATQIQGAGKTEASAIKGAMLEGYKKIPDCSYTDYGASMMLNERTGEYISAVVLAGA
ncbi:MAG: hypothetical protein ACRDTS_15125 [Mycobacterium sp.]